MARGSKILVVGGYGMVGRQLAEQLGPEFPGQVVIGGRNLDKAEVAAESVGNGSSAVRIDIFGQDFAESLEGVGLVVVCLDQTNTDFARACLTRGISYVDISARWEFLKRMSDLDALARASGATGMLSVGAAPGLTNLLAARAASHVPNADRIDILVELGLGDRHGRTAIEWTLDNLHAPFVVTQEHMPVQVRGFDAYIDFPLPAAGLRRGYRFNFSDQHTLPTTLSVGTVSTWLRFKGAAVTWVIAHAVRLGVAEILQRSFWRSMALWLLDTIHVGSDQCMVAARATSSSGTYTCALEGRNEARMTATVAGVVVSYLMSGDSAAGVHHIEEVLQLSDTLDVLKGEVVGLRLTEADAAPPEG